MEKTKRVNLQYYFNEIKQFTGGGGGLGFISDISNCYMF